MFNFKKSTPEQVKCNHIYNDYVRMSDPKRICVTMYLRCMNCNETISIDVSPNMLKMLFNDIGEHGVWPR